VKGLSYEDVPGFCKSATLAEIKAADYALAPGRYVGAPEVEDDGEPIDEKIARLTKELLEAFDILSHKGTVGRIAVAPTDAPDFVCSPQTTFWRSLEPGVLDQLFLRYVMKSIGFTRQLDVLKGQTDMAPYVSLSDQRSMTIDLPGIGIQQAIGEALGTLDDKIAANERICATADDLARLMWLRSTRAGEPVSLSGLASFVTARRSRKALPVMAAS
jgi:hypothetical protein